MAEWFIGHPKAANTFPLKQCWDLAALGKIMLGGRLHISKSVIETLNFSQRLACLRFYLKAHGIRNLYATIGRSGWHWSLLGVQLAMDLKAGGDGDFYYVEPFWVPSTGFFQFTELEWRHAYNDNYLAAPVRNPVLFHTQHPYYRLRTVPLKSMQTVVIVRNIIKSVESNYFKVAQEPDNPVAEDARHFDWEQYALTAIEFSNSWGDAKNWHPSLRTYRYEDLLAEPVPVIKEITDYWGLELPVECLKEAFSRITKGAMKNKLEQQGITSQYRVSFRSSIAAAPAEGISRIRSTIHKHLIHDFGYDYE